MKKKSQETKPEIRHENRKLRFMERRAWKEKTLDFDFCKLSFSRTFFIKDGNFWTLFPKTSFLQDFPSYMKKHSLYEETSDMKI